MMRDWLKKQKRTVNRKWSELQGKRENLRQARGRADEQSGAVRDGLSLLALWNPLIRSFYNIPLLRRRIQREPDNPRHLVDLAEAMAASRRIRNLKDGVLSVAMPPFAVLWGAGKLWEKYAGRELPEYHLAARALELARRKLDKREDLAGTFEEIGRALLILGKRKHSLRCLKRALALDPNNPGPWFYIAMIQAGESREKTALEYLSCGASLGNSRCVNALAHIMKKNHLTGGPYRKKYLLLRTRDLLSHGWRGIVRGIGLPANFFLEKEPALRRTIHRLREKF